MLGLVVRDKPNLAKGEKTDEQSFGGEAHEPQIWPGFLPSADSQLLEREAEQVQHHYSYIKNRRSTVTQRLKAQLRMPTLGGCQRG